MQTTLRTQKTRRSTTGFVITIGDSPISWCSKLRHWVSTSTAEAEYYSLSEGSKHCMWYINLLKELKSNNSGIEVNIDNKAAIYNAKKKKKKQLINPRTKHMDIRWHYVRELVKNNKIILKYVKFQHNLEDGFMKFLNGTSMNKFKNSLLTQV